MWRNLKFLHIYHVCDVENVTLFAKFMLFCCKIILNLRAFVAKYILPRFTHLCVEKFLFKNCGEKNTNITYAIVFYTQFEFKTKYQHEETEKKTVLQKTLILMLGLDPSV